MKIKVKKPWIGYPGSTLQQNYAEALTHGYLLWDIKSEKSFDVEFKELSNPKPYVTVNWLGSVTKTIEHITKTFNKGSRFRIYNKTQLAQQDVISLSTALRDVMQATEVTFKSDQQITRDLIISGSTNVVKEDLRNPDVLFKLIKEYHHDNRVSDKEWSDVADLMNNYVIESDVDGVVRNTKWSLRHVKFDNTFAYGEGNEINFDKLSGIVGIFGPNRSGKSSVVGTLMYSLFNGTDRGSMKNLHVINTRKPYCYARAIINVNGTDYILERQTVKHESKRGVNAATALNVFRFENDEAVDLAGEQRFDTEKVVRRLIGSPEDFLLTSLAAQDDVKLFISQGSTRRRQVLSRFLDLDIFDKMYDMAKSDFNAAKAILKSLPDRDWPKLERDAWLRMNACDDAIQEKTAAHNDVSERLEALKSELNKHSDFTPVSQAQVEALRKKVSDLRSKLDELNETSKTLQEAQAKLSTKSTTIQELLTEHDVLDLKRRLTAQRELEMSLAELKHVYESEDAVVKQHEKSLKLLDTVPCGDAFPKCKFIKDAHQSKEKVEKQRIRTERARKKFKEAEEQFNAQKDKNLEAQIEKLEQLAQKQQQITIDLSSKRFELHRNASSIAETTKQLEDMSVRLEGLELALKNDENAEVVLLRTQVETLAASLKTIDREKLDLATERGRIQTLIDSYDSERQRREETMQKTRAHELVTAAFSRKGIPSVITRSQLPLINSEIAKILQGIVDFTIQLETDDESDSMEIFIDYGDSRRIIELCSGMEKMIASVAIRVALINVSSLPKTDMFIIDEGFGALDEASVEACNRLLASLKRYFKTVIVITHVEGVKDAADIVIEISKNEKDAKVNYV